MKIYAIPNAHDILKAFAFRNKYDMFSSEAVRQILEAIKNFKENNRFFLEINKTKIDVEIIKDASMMTEPYNEYPFKITAFAENAHGLNEIVVTIILNNDFSSKNYEQVNNSLYEVLRHEFEHIDGFTNHKKMDNQEYVDLYKKIMKEKNPYENKEKVIDHIKDISKYMLSNEEFFSYVRSMVYIAKKQNKKVSDIIDMFFNRSFYNYDSKIFSMVKDDVEVQNIIKETREKLMNKIDELYPNLRTLLYTVP